MMEPRLPPFDGDAEEATLGSLLLDSSCMADVVGELSPDDFYRDQNREVFVACLALWQRNEGINQVTVAHQLGDKLDVVGGAAYLLHLLNCVPTPLHALDYARIVKNCSDHRRLLVCGEEIIRLGYSDDPLALPKAQDLVFRMGDEKDKGASAMEILKDELPHLLARVQEPFKLAGISTGFKDLDWALNGLERGRLYLIGGFAKSGKSRLCHNICAHIGKSRWAVYFSLEMPREQLIRRFIFSEARLNARAKSYTPEEIDRFNAVAGAVAELKLYIEDEGKLDTRTVQARVMSFQHKHEIGLVVVDYVHLLADRGESDNQRIGEAIKNLKNIARICGVPVIAISQLNRKATDEIIPSVGHLFGSSSLEYAADAVLFVHNWDWYISQGLLTKDDIKRRWGFVFPYQPNVMNILIPIQRDGASGKVNLFYDSASGYLGNLEEQERGASTTP